MQTQSAQQGNQVLTRETDPAARFAAGPGGAVGLQTHVDFTLRDDCTPKKLPPSFHSGSARGKLVVIQKLPCQGKSPS